jgi:hypothetical protein
MEAFVEENWFTQGNVPFSNSGPFRRLFYVKSSETRFDYTCYNTKAISDGFSLSDLFVHDTELIAALEDVDGTFHTTFNQQFDLNNCLNNNTLTFRITNTLYGRDYHLYLRFKQVTTQNISTIIASQSGEIRMLVKLTFSSFALANKLNYETALEQTKTSFTSAVEQKRLAILNYENMKQKNMTAVLAHSFATREHENASNNVTVALDKLNDTTEILTALSSDTTTTAYKNALVAKNNASATYNLALTAQEKTGLDLSKATSDLEISDNETSTALNAMNNAVGNVNTTATAIITATDALIVPTQNYIRASTDPYLIRRHLSERVSVITTEYNYALSNVSSINTYLINCSNKNRVANLEVVLEKPVALEKLSQVSSENQMIYEAVAKEKIGDYSAVTQLLINFATGKIESARLNASNQATIVLNTPISFNKMNLYAEQKIKEKIVEEKKIAFIAAEAEEVVAIAEYETALAEETAVDTPENQAVIDEKQLQYDNFAAEEAAANASYAAAQEEEETAVEELATAENEAFIAEADAIAAKETADSLISGANTQFKATQAKEAVEMAKDAVEEANRKNEIVLQKKENLYNKQLQVNIFKLIVAEKKGNKEASLAKLNDSKNVVNLQKAKTKSSLAKKKAAGKKKSKMGGDYALYDNTNTTLEDSIYAEDAEQAMTNLTVNSGNAQAGAAAANALLNADQLTVNDVKQFLNDYAASDTSGESANNALNNMLSGDILGSLTNLYDLVSNYDPAAAALKAGMDMEAAIKRGDPEEAAKIAAKAALVALMVSALADAVAAGQAAKDITDKLNQDPPDVAGATIVATKFLARRILARIEIIQFMVGFTSVLVLAALDPLNKSIQAGLDAAKKQMDQYSNFAKENAIAAGAELSETKEFRKASEIAMEIASFAEDIYALAKNYDPASEGIAKSEAEQALRDGDPARASAILGKATLVKVLVDLIEDEAAAKKAESESSAELNKTPPNVIGATTIMANLVADRAVARIKTGEMAFTFGSILVTSQAASANQALNEGLEITDTAFNQLGSDIQSGIIFANNSLPVPLNLSPTPQAQIDNLIALRSAAIEQMRLDHAMSETSRGLNQLLADTDEQFYTIIDQINFLDEAEAEARRLYEEAQRGLMDLLGL